MQDTTDTADPIDVTEVEPEPEVGVAVEHVATPVPIPAASPMAELATIPSDSELRTLVQLATTFAYSALVPVALRQKPEDCLLVLLTARDLGLSVTVAFRECHPIDGRVTVSPKLKLAIVRQRALGRVWADPDNDVNHHTWHAARADDPTTVYTVRYQWADAQRAGLVQQGCTPDDHSDQCKTGSAYGASPAQKRKACKSNWQTYPGQMLQWRAMGYLMDQAFGEVGTGLYSADELGALTDDEGRIIEVSEVGPVPGMPDHTPAKREPGTAPEDVCPEDVRKDLAERIYALPHPAIEVLREQWARRNADEVPLLWPLPVLPNRQARSADALVAGFERRATGGEWGPWSPTDSASSEPEAASEPADAPECPAAPDAAVVAPEAQEPPQGPESDDTSAAPAEPFDRQATAVWLDGLDDLGVADLLTTYELDGGGTKVAKRRRILDHLEAQAAEPAEG